MSSEKKEGEGAPIPLSNCLIATIFTEYETEDEDD